MAAQSLRHQSGPLTRALCVAFASLLLAAGGLFGCAGHEAQTLPVRSALDAGHPHKAIQALDEALGVAKDTDLPDDLTGDKALFLLDRATVQQSLARFDRSKTDFQAADKAIDMLDLAHNAGDSIGAYVFSGSSERYVAPPYEKLLVNTLNMLNYLETRDLEGALVEARRLTVMQKYVKDDLGEGDNAILGLGGFLAGLAYEKSGKADEALRYYDDALRFTGYHSLRDTVRELADKSPYRSPRLTQLLQGSSAGGDAGGEVVVVVGYGRVPHKIPQRVPIGLALTLVSNDISPYDHARANRLAAQGLVTWINYPTLAPGQGAYDIPICWIDGRPVALEQAVDISAQVRAEWHKIEGKIILSAITRMIARLMVGEAIRSADKKSPIALLLSLGAQATLTVLDTPDTRSWETLPARIAIARVRLPPGEHTIRLDARGVSRTGTVKLEDGDWTVFSLQALR
jgi:uncharacterized protein